MIEPEFSLFDVEVEESPGEASVLGQASLGVTPEGLDAVDMTGAASKFVVTVVDAKVTLVSNVNQPVIPLPSIGVNDAFVTHFTLDDGFQSQSRAIIEDIGEDHSATLVDANHWNLSSCSSTPLASHTPCPEVTFIDFNDTFEGSRSRTLICQPHSHRQHISVDRVHMQTRQMGDFRRLQIDRKKPQKMAKLRGREARPFDVFVSHR